MIHLLNYHIAVETQDHGKGTVFHHVTLASRAQPALFVFRTVRAGKGGLVHPDDLVAALHDIWPAYIQRVSEASRKNLTTTQRRAYEHILEFWKDEGRAPLQEELADMNNTSKGAAGTMINRLEGKGWIWRDNDRRPVPYDLALPQMTGREEGKA